MEEPASRKNRPIDVVRAVHTPTTVQSVEQ